MTRALRTLVTFAVLTLVAGLFGIGVAAADEPEPDPMAGVPAVGACYDLTLKQAYGHATAEAPVDCTARHTMVVTAIGELPASVDWAGFDWKQKKFPVALARAINATCDPAARKLLGPDRVRALTLYQDYWFAPAKAAVTAGARWFSCLVSLTTSTSLLPIPTGQPAKLSGSIPDTVARCAKRTKGGYSTVACSRPHQWRVAYTKLISGKLTDKSLLKAAQRTCPRHVSSPEWLYFGRYVSRTSYVVGCSDKTRR